MIVTERDGTVRATRKNLKIIMKWNWIELKSSDSINFEKKLNYTYMTSTLLSYSANNMDT